MHSLEAPRRDSTNECLQLVGSVDSIETHR